MLIRYWALIAAVAILIAAVSPARAADAVAIAESRGDYAAAIDHLQHALNQNPPDRSTIEMELAQAYILARTDSMGMSYLPQAQRILDSLGNEPALQAERLCAQGELDLASQRATAAADAFESAVKAAEGNGDKEMIARAAANAAVAHLTVARSEIDADQDAGASVAAAIAMNAKAWQAAAILPPGHDTSFLLLTIGQTDEALSTMSASGPQLQLAAYAAYQRALALAPADDQIIRSYAMGYTGHLYEIQGRNDEASRLTAQALFLAQQSRQPNLLYLWQWQSGRLLRATGDRDGAIAALQSAVASLQSIQTDLSAGGGNSSGGISFRDAAGAVYYQLADLLLHRAGDAPNIEEQQRDLADARDTIENLKTAELQNYFQDRCEHLLEEQRRSIETIDPHSAVVYFVPLPDRLEILVASGSSLIQRYTAPVQSAELAQIARRFRVEVCDQSSEEYFADAQQLYRWLIAPIEPLPKSVDTLVFVPDGALRSIPMDALADPDGKFLIEKYAVAVSPGMRLTEARTDQEHALPSRILISGLSIASGGFPALKFVPEEVRQIDHEYAGHDQTLLNQDFDTAGMDRQFQQTNYTIVHIASHGHFGSSAQDTFILDYGGELDLDELERLIEPSKFRSRPVDLLTLSACETAAGDDRAALGLAGIAVKAGALSAMATLWSVNDRSSAILMPRFYAHLADAGSTKAKALQAAQLELLDRPEFQSYRHPYFWSPYLIVGNWL